MTDDDTPPSEDKPGGLGDPSWVDQIVARAMAKAEAAAAGKASESATQPASTRPVPSEPAPDPEAPPATTPTIRSLADRPEPVADDPPAPAIVAPVTAAPTPADPIAAAPVLEPVAATRAPNLAADTAGRDRRPNAEGPGDAPAEDSLDLMADDPAPPALDAAVPTSASDEADGADGDLLEGLEEDHESSRTRTIIEWGAVIVGALAVAFLIKTFLLQAFFIPSGSMEPTLAVGDRVLVNKLSYDFHDVRRGDLIVFERPQAESGGVPDLIKRVIALPGEEIEFRDGTIYIDDRRLVEPYLADDFRTEGFGLTAAGQELCSGTESCQIPEGYVFVMGDNRPDSRDSRFFGPVEESSIVGRAFLRVWPLNNIGFL